MDSLNTSLNRKYSSNAQLALADAECRPSAGERSKTGLLAKLAQRSQRLNRRSEKVKTFEFAGIAG